MREKWESRSGRSHDEQISWWTHSVFNANEIPGKPVAFPVYTKGSLFSFWVSDRCTSTVCVPWSCRLRNVEMQLWSILYNIDLNVFWDYTEWKFWLKSKCSYTELFLEILENLLMLLKLFMSRKNMLYTNKIFYLIISVCICEDWPSHDCVHGQHWKLHYLPPSIS